MPFLRTSDVARRAGVSTDTIRFYERRGVLPPATRGHNRYRLYTDDAVDRVLLVRRALGVGFTLAELARVLRVRDRGGVPCGEVRALAQARLDAIGRQLRELRAMQKLLRALVAAWDGRLAGTPPGKQARLLELLPVRPPAHKRLRVDIGARSRP